MERETQERSREEEAELKRSTKKVKDSHPSFGDGSFKDKLLGDLPGAYAQAFQFNPLKEDETFSDDEVDELSEGVAAVRFSGDDKARIRGRWAFTLIIKPFGRNVGFHFLHNKILALWKPAGHLECIDLEFGFYLIRFGLAKDYDKVLREGPWFIGGQFLSIRAWKPYFKPSTAKCSSVAVWVRLPKLLNEFFEQKALKDIRQAIGFVLRIDTHTASKSRGCFARICVQVNLDNPLIRTIMIGKFAQPVIYEGLNTLCFSCGRVGHKKEACPFLVHEGVHVDSSELNTSTLSSPSPTHNATTETYGTWTLVSRRKDKNPKSRAHPEPKNQPPNSRNGDSKSTPSPQSPSRGPRDAKRKSPAMHCDTTPHPKPSHPSSEMGHDSAVSGHTSLEQPSPPIAFSFGEPHSPKKSPNIKFSSSPKHVPNPKLILNKHGQRNQLKGKGETIGEPRNTGMGNILQREDHSHLKHHDRRDQATPTHIMGWFEEELLKAWSHIFPLTPESRRNGSLPLSDPAWFNWHNP